ncbi:ABC transporter substrate-binding protein [Rivibacter subsaxonicus]|uniref:ABC-type transport system substrate-binding protein n=1 Tax=Rivibacter subsaxonicus TaxID=457575 RepID=A0A4Q7VWE0_9BURK|nr:ABC transporter substrate-binding protein [Rivibacter subsaxonicus]RZU01044.1 ABC-type transport system substrate-binding protein [Rivibacter subsaxonicus]
MTGALLRALLGGALLSASLVASAAQPVAGTEPPRTLRYAFPKAETGFDPAQISDIYSRIVTAHIFETPLAYDHLARPYKLRPSTAREMPEISEDFRSFTFRLRPGIYFADDPAFKGQRRELVAQDYVYSIKRIYDPKLKSPAQSSLEDEGIIGLRELREAALKGGKPFDYDREVEGIRALDRYTLQVRLRESRPRHLITWAGRDLYGAVAREVVEAYGEQIMEHPVGTGPFMLKEWRRSSRMVLERNPGFRDEVYDAEPNADDAEGQALLARLRGRRLPMVDRVEVSVIEEAQPRWLAFLNEEQDLLERLPEEFAGQAIPGGKLAPNLRKRGVQQLSVLGSDITLTVFNMDDPLVGGYTPERVALRRAMVLGNDQQREIRLARRDQAIPAQAINTPGTSGFRAELRTESSEYSPARAKALLDLYGYVDRDGDGWRELPDGKPLLLMLNTQSDQQSRQLDELWKKNMDALGLRATLKTAQWPENLKAARAGNFMIWRVGSSAAGPDGQSALERAYGPSVGKGNLARIRLPAFDAIYERLKLMPDGPERQAGFDEANKLLVAYAPYRFGVHRIYTDLAFPWLVGYRRPPVWLDWWQYVDIDPALQAKSAQ